MTRDEMIEAMAAVTDPKKERQTIYRVLDELGVAYKKTNCGKCLTDLWNIAREELGMIADASSESQFNGSIRYEYLKDRQYVWRGKILDGDTPPDVIEQFMAFDQRGGEFYRRIVETE